MKCKGCGKTFKTKKGLGAHQRWCTQGGSSASAKAELKIPLVLTLDLSGLKFNLEVSHAQN